MKKSGFLVFLLASACAVAQNPSNLYKQVVAAPGPTRGAVAAGDTYYTTSTSGAIGRLAPPSPGSIQIGYYDFVNHKPAWGFFGSILGLPTCVDTGGQHLNWTGTSWGCGTSGGGASVLPVVDTTSVVKGSSDATKQLRFEVDGFTTGTTHVVTFSDSDGTPAWNDLSNLANPTAINRSLIGGSGIDVGSASVHWGNVYSLAFVCSQGSAGCHIDLRGAGSTLGPPDNGYRLFTDGTGFAIEDVAGHIASLDTSGMSTLWVYRFPDTGGTFGVLNGSFATDDCVKYNGAGSLVSTGGPCAAAGANTALSNVASTAISADLIPGSDITYTLGSLANQWLDAYMRALHVSGSGGNGFLELASQGTAPSAPSASGSLRVFAKSGDLNWTNDSGVRVHLDASLLSSGQSIYTLPVGGGTFGVLNGSFTDTDCLEYSGGRIITAGATCGSGSGGSPGLLAVDANISTGTAYRLTGAEAPGGSGYLELTPSPTFETTIANALTTVPAGWEGWQNSSNCNSADANSTNAHQLYIKVTTTGQDYGAGTRAACLPYKTFVPGSTDQVFVMRFVPTTLNTSQKYHCLIFADVDHTNWDARICGNGTSGTDSIFTDYHNNGSQVATRTISGLNIQSGFWFLAILSGANFQFFYSLSTSTDPPTGASWSRALEGSAFWSRRVYAGVYMYTGSGTVDGRVAYWDDTAAQGSKYLNNPTSGGGGYDTSNSAIDLVSDRVIGTTTTLTDANLQAALALAVNRRSLDAGSWTFCSKRAAGSQPSLSGCSYVSAASVTTGGTGDHYRLSAKCNSNGTQACSIYLPFASVPLN